MASQFVAVDGFYPNPNEVRRAALRRTFMEVDDIVGWRTRPYFPPRIHARLERVFRVKICEWDADPDDLELANGSFFIALSQGKHAEAVGIHADDPVNWTTVLVYLTPNAPVDTGTSFWQHKNTRLTSWPTPKDARRLGVRIHELRAILHRDGIIRSRWREVDRIGNVYNRAVLFPSSVLHSATRHFGKDKRRGRVFQLFRFRAARTPGQGK